MTGLRTLFAALTVLMSGLAFLMGTVWRDDFRFGSAQALTGGALVLAACVACLVLKRTSQKTRAACETIAPDFSVSSSDDVYARLLAENTSELVVLAHNDGRRVYVSPASTRLLGFPQQQLAQLHLRNCVHPRDLRRVLRTILRMIGDRSEARVDFRARHASGDFVWLEGIFRRVGVHPTGDEPTIIATFRSIEERHAHAEELEKSKEFAEAAARVKSDFLSNMSHEMRTPLTGLLGICDLLATDRSLNAAQRRLLNLATESGRVLLAVVNDVLDFSLIDAGKLKLESLPLSVRSLVEGVFAMVGGKVRHKRLSLRAEFDADVPQFVYGDPVRLRQIFLNLLGNAIKFTHAGEITVRVAAPGGVLRVEVTDSGIGIPAEALPHLFDRFTQADTSVTRRFGGSGLGLAICKQILLLMNGKIGAVSTPGEGSMFWFEIPLVPVANDVKEPIPATLAAEPRRKLRVLLAEDNAINREIIVAATRHQGHEVVAVDDGRAAFEACCQSEFDIVLMDVQMPGTDGIAGTAMIRAHEARDLRNGAMPIIALTANALASETERYLRAGMNAHVAKPIVWAQLFETIDTLTRGKTARSSDAIPSKPGCPRLDTEPTGTSDQLELAALLASFRCEDAAQEQNAA